MGVEVPSNSTMKSTWRRWDKSQWQFHHKLLNLLGAHPTDLDRVVPVHAKTDSMPYIPHWQGHKWILIHALWPICVHQLYVFWSGHNLNPVSAFFFYTVAFKVNAIREIRMMRELGHCYGYLDGDKHERDQIPDNDVQSTAHSLQLTAAVRPIMTVFLSYRQSQLPSETNWWWVPVEIGLYGIILDFWFYWYHRCMHDVDGLWRFRTCIYYATFLRTH